MMMIVVVINIVRPFDSAVFVKYVLAQKPHKI